MKRLRILIPRLEEIIQNAITVVLKKDVRSLWLRTVCQRLLMPTKFLVLNKGGIVERGMHDELMQLNGQYAEMVALQKG